MSSYGYRLVRTYVLVLNQVSSLHLLTLMLAIIRGIAFRCHHGFALLLLGKSVEVLELMCRSKVSLIPISIASHCTFEASLLDPHDFTSPAISRPLSPAILESILQTIVLPRSTILLGARHLNTTRLVPWSYFRRSGSQLVSLSTKSLSVYNQSNPQRMQRG